MICYFKQKRGHTHTHRHSLIYLEGCKVVKEITGQALKGLFKLPTSHDSFHGMNSDMLLKLFFEGTQQQNIMRLVIQ